MNWDRIQGHWKQLTGQAREQWGKLTDDDLGLVYLPGSCPTNNFYGGARPGDNLFGNSLICLDAVTGKRRWHYQFVHHDIWDLDLPCAPNLVDIKVGGRRIKAVAQVTKQGFTFKLSTKVTGAKASAKGVKSASSAVYP